jgi:hypothetical protein
MEPTSDHYALLLGLKEPWEVTEVKLNVEQLKVDITSSSWAYQVAAPSVI